MTPPPKLTDGQMIDLCESINNEARLSHFKMARAIEVARDQMWTEMLAGQVPVAALWQHGETGRTRITTPDSITDCDARWHKAADLYTHPHPDDTALLREALYVIQAWENDCDREDYWRDRDDAITKLTERLK